MWREKLPALTAQWRPVRSDNRLQAWEWLLLPDGRVLKTDPVDHRMGHDYVGAQDIAWDVAGAEVEFELTPVELERFWRRLANAGCRPPFDWAHSFYRVCYLGFQVGYYAQAAELSCACPDERTRLESTCARYVGRLRKALSAGAGAAIRTARG